MNILKRPNTFRAGRKLLVAGLLVTAMGLGATSPRAAEVNVTTRSYNGARTGANTSETLLRQSTVNKSNFRKRFTVAVDDEVYAQPLLVTGVTGIPAHPNPVNVLYVATANNTVYAINADLGYIIWGRNFNGNARPPKGSELGTDCEENFDQSSKQGQASNGNVGIIGTPVIDLNKGQIYFVTHLNSNGTMAYFLQAMNIATGASRTPVLIQDGGELGFINPQIENQRPGLAISQNAVYVGFSSYCDQGTWHGWLLSYDESTLQQVAVYSTTPTGIRGGIWGTGQAPVIDPLSGDVFVATGNGDWDGTSNYGDSIIHLSARTLHVVDYFTPSNQSDLAAHDLDLGVAGPTLVIANDGTRLMMQGSKEGKLYKMFADHLNGLGGELETMQVVPSSGGADNGIVAWNPPTPGTNIYVMGGGDTVRAYKMDPLGGTNWAGPFDVAPTPTSGGGMITLSANGSASGTGILWVANPLYNHSPSTVRTLYALNAENLSELWDSNQNAGDALGTGAFWNPPVVANGEVYVATNLAGMGNAVSEYGPSFVYAISTPFRRPPLVLAQRVTNSVRTTAGALHVGLDLAFYTRPFSNGQWGVPTALSGVNFAPATAAVAFGQQTSTQNDAFVVGSDGKLYMTSQLNGGAWQALTPLTVGGFAPAGAPMTTVTQGGQLSVFVIDSTGKLQIVWWNPAVGWSGPVALTQAGYAPLGAYLASGIRSSGEVDIFAVGTDGALKYMAFNGLTWSGPAALTVTNFAPVGAPVTTALDVHGFMNVMTVANDGALYTKWDATPLWAGPTALTPTGSIPPGGGVSTVNFNNSSLNAFYVDNDGFIQQLSNAGTSWQGPNPISAEAAAPGASVSAVYQGTAELDVFTLSAGAASGVVESIKTGTGWAPPAALP